MPSGVSKAKRILDMLQRGASPSDIVEALKTTRGYIAVVEKRAESPSHRRPCDRQWEEANADKVRDQARERMWRYRERKAAARRGERNA